MSGKSLPRPTEAELQLLRSPLGKRAEHGPANPRGAAAAKRARAIRRPSKSCRKCSTRGCCGDEAQRSHVYEAVGKADETQRQLVRDLLRRAFGGAAGKLVVQALSEENVSAGELAEIRRVLDELETRQTKKRTK